MIRVQYPMKGDTEGTNEDKEVCHKYKHDDKSAKTKRPCKDKIKYIFRQQSNGVS